jgi:hypothetical protein
MLRFSSFFLFILVVGTSWFFFQKQTYLTEDFQLKKYIKHNLPFSVVFTSRSNTSSFDPIPPEGSGVVYPGEGMFQAIGRLRMLTPAGKVFELTWNRKLPDGGTLLDVLSPSISPDGKRVLFAGRKGPPDHGRFRIYEIDLQDFSIRALTGFDSDMGCVKLPPMRHDGNGSMLSDSIRMKIDFDDIDPIELSDVNRTLVFSSSREPDLGRNHSRRSMQIWRWARGNSTPTPMTANRNVDRWPWQLSSNAIAFSLWSRNFEVVSSGRDKIEYYSSTRDYVSFPTDRWMTMFLNPQGLQFGLLAKAPFSHVRTRALEDGRLVFMAHSDQNPGFYKVGICNPGWIGDYPSSHPVNVPLVATETKIMFFPENDKNGNTIRLGTPTPFPGNKVFLSMSNQESAGSFGLALAGVEDLTNEIPQVVFDDPEFVDAEPIVVLPRIIKAGGRNIDGDNSRFQSTQKTGLVFAASLDYSAMNSLPGQLTDIGEGPIFPPPPSGLIHEIKIYASERDRFDHSENFRVPGNLNLLSTIKVNDNSASGLVPSGEPTLLVGFDVHGKVALWNSNAKDSLGRQNSILGFAGDHYSLISPGKKHFCVGCHPGHSGLTSYEHKHNEIWDYKFR